MTLGASIVSAQERKVMRDAATHDQLSAALKQEQANDPLRHLRQVEGKDPSKENQPQDLLSRSDILCFNGLATLVPKQSILAVPSQFADRIGMKEGAKLVSWNEFFTVNRGWLITLEITLNQAKGQVPLGDAVNDRLTKSSNIVVSTLQGGPISLLKYSPPSPAN